MAHFRPKLKKLTLYGIVLLNITRIINFILIGGFLGNGPKLGPKEPKLVPKLAQFLAQSQKTHFLWFCIAKLYQDIKFHQNRLVFKRFPFLAPLAKIGPPKRAKTGVFPQLFWGKLNWTFNN